MNYRYLFASTPALLVAICSMALAQSFDRDRLVGDGSSSAKQIAPVVRVAPDGSAYVIWTDFRDGTEGQVYLARSTDRGETFSAGRKVTAASRLQAGMQRGAQIVIDRNGVLHMSWQEVNGNGNISARYARSNDGGLSFGAPLAVAADSGLYNQDFPSIAVDSSGNPYLAWIDTREKETGSSTNAQLYVVRSTDGGTTFEKPVRATYLPRGEGGTCECCNTSIAVSRTGNVFVSFRSNINNNRDIYIARSLDGGSTFRCIKAAGESWRLNACPMTGSSIAVDRDEKAHVVWRDSRPSSNGVDFIYYTSLRLADTACAPDRRISTTTARSNYPSLAITPEGFLLCAFQDTRNDAADVYYTLSTDGGATFSPDTKLTHETGTSRQELPSVAIAPDGTRYAVWQDSRLGVEHIMLTRGEAGASAVGLVAGPTFAIGSLHPNPVASGRSARLDLSIPADARLRIEIHDMSGSLVAVPYSGSVTAGTNGLSIDTSGLIPGIYQFTVTCNGRRVARPFVVR
jgi:hypothetical protein